MDEQTNPFSGLLRGAVTMLAVSDLETSVRFYQEKLGFDVLGHEAHIAALKLGDMQLHLFTHSPPTPDKPSVTLTSLNTPDRTPVVLDFLVSDCQAAYERLRDRGVQFLTPHTPPWGGRRCFAQDPDNYLIELEENPTTPFLRSHYDG